MSSFALTPLLKRIFSRSGFTFPRIVKERRIEWSVRFTMRVHSSQKGPFRGHVKPSLTARGLRFRTLTRYPNYIIVYRPDTRPLAVVAVVHGKRNIKRVLKERLD